jgi:prevent-host-death family protein
MRTMAISKFKATCLAVIEEVRKTGKPLLITKKGVPVAQVLPAPPVEANKRRLGALAGTVTYMGDIISPAADPDEWEVLRK